MSRRDIPSLIRGGTLAFAALAFIATAVQVGSSKRGRGETSTSQAIPDPLAAQLVRCNATTLGSATDETCEHAWAENRRRFLSLAPGGLTSSGVGRTPQTDRGAAP